MLHVIKAKYVADHRVELWFNDGAHGEVDLNGVLTGPIFAPLQDVSYFRQFQLQGNTLAWENGADFAPEYLHALIPADSPA